jgi:TRAP-type C4-dicarboxylate transport system substrate-binding protein
MDIGFCAPRRLGRALLFAAACFSVNPAVQAADHWKAYTYNAAATVTAVKGLNALFSQIEKDTNGELRIRLNLGGTLSIAATDITEAVAGNVVQFGDDAFFVGSVPVGGIVRLPMFIRSSAEFEKAWNAEEPYLKATYAKKDVVVVGHYVFPYNVLWSRKKTTTLAEIAGQKIRVISPEQAEFIKRLGGIPITLGTSEVAAALDRGVIDGVLTASSGYGYIWRDLLKYRYSLDVSFIDSLLLVNKDAWDKLSPENRTKVQAAIGQATQHITSAMAAEEDSLTSQLASKGIVVTTPTAADLAQAEKLITPYWDGWAKARGGDAPEAMKKVRAAIGR